VPCANRGCNATARQRLAIANSFFVFIFGFPNR
jgi:hypothetical protein